MAKLYSDENQNGKYDAGTDVDVTANYDFAWVFNGNSKQLAAAGGIANASFDNNDIVIPQTNEQARTSLNGSDRDGKTALQSRQTATAFRAIRCLSFTNTTNAHNSIPVWECCFPPVLLSDALSKTG